MANRFLSLLVSFLVSSFCYSQSTDSLKILIKDMQKGKNDLIRFSANEKFHAGLLKILSNPESFSQNFDSLKNISVIKPEDNFFRILTWVVPHYDGNSYDYYGFIQLHTDTSYSLITLKDSTASIRKPESEKLTADRWLGVVYYSVVPLKRSGKTYYTLLGWKGKNQQLSQKVIDVLYFDRLQPKFGYPVIKAGSVFRNRLVFTFNAQATMTLHFEKSFNGIVFDHISSNKNNISIINGPDGTYDALKIKKGKWILLNDVDVRTKWQPNETLPVPPDENITK